MFYIEKVICWAISAAGIVADNHVVSETVNWKPNLSTTWCLASYPQYKCEGGIPALLYQDISKNGIATNNCIDYSWCSENEACNGKATKHFEVQSDEKVNLSDLIPTKGACYDSSSRHYLYFIDTPTSMSIGTDGLTGEDFTNTVKKHIYYHGPVQGGFLVFNNFMSGAFTKVNGGVYLEDGDYSGGQVKFDPNQLDMINYKGCHAIAIIGWGIEKNVVVDNYGNKKDIPYWYCRNSWTEKWGDGGYFKMAMYPYNNVVQFDKTVLINGETAGGMIMITASKPPESLTLEQIDDKFKQKLSNPASYYSTETKDYGDEPTPISTPTPDYKHQPTHTPGHKHPTPGYKHPTRHKSKSGSKKILYIILVCILLIAVIAGLFVLFFYRNTTNYNMLSPISSSYTPSTPNLSYHPSTPA